MGIIISCYQGIGATYLINICKDKAKILDARGIDEDKLLQAVTDGIAANDIVIIGSSAGIRKIFNEQNVNYDLFYPSKDRRQEFIENMVRKHVSPSAIRNMDMEFDKMIDELDEENSSNVYKHKLVNHGEFLGNNLALRQYIQVLATNKQ